MSEGSMKTWDDFEDQLLPIQRAHHMSPLMRLMGNKWGAPSPANFWAWREAVRFVTGENQYILPFDDRWKDWFSVGPHFLSYFPAVSRMDKNLISYVPDATMGMSDRRTHTKIGKFMTAVAPETPPSHIADLSNRYSLEASPPELLIGTTIEDFYNVYEAGPDSCMARKGWNMDQHPVTIYAQEDGKGQIGIAYLRKGNDITARCIVRLDEVWPRFTRVYGNESAMRTMMSRANWEPATNGLHGLPLRTVWRAGREEWNRIVMPYIDAPASYVMVHLDDMRIWVIKDERAKRSLALANNVDPERCIVLGAGSQHGYVSSSAFMNPKRRALMQPCGICGTQTLKGDLRDLFDSPLKFCPVCRDNGRVRIAYVSRDGNRAFVLADHDDLRFVRPHDAWVMISHVDPCQLWKDIVWLENYEDWYGLSSVFDCFATGEKHPLADAVNVKRIKGFEKRAIHPLPEDATVEQMMMHDAYGPFGENTHEPKTHALLKEAVRISKNWFMSYDGKDPDFDGYHFFVEVSGTQLVRTRKSSQVWHPHGLWLITEGELSNVEKAKGMAAGGTRLVRLEEWLEHYATVEFNNPSADVKWLQDHWRWTCAPFGIGNLAGYGRIAEEVSSRTRTRTPSRRKAL